MKLIFEKSVKGRKLSLLPPCDVERVELPDGMKRAEKPALPEMSETDLSRHYTANRCTASTTGSARSAPAP